MLPIIPLKSRIAALPGLQQITFLGSVSAVTLHIAYTIGPVSWVGYLPAALAGVIGKVEETNVGQHEVYVAVDVDGETTLYDNLRVSDAEPVSMAS